VVAEETFGQRVRRVREERRVTLRELAARVGSPMAALSEVERDLRPPDHDVERRLRQWLGSRDPGTSGA
jgi:transcriptional regulator with XRE-family HTH domain